MSARLKVHALGGIPAFVVGVLLGQTGFSAGPVPWHWLLVFLACAVSVALINVMLDRQRLQARLDSLPAPCSGCDGTGRDEFNDTMCWLCGGAGR